MKKVMKNDRKIYFLSGLVGVLLLTVVIMFNKGYGFPSVWANPDYICIKNVDMSCTFNPNNLCQTATDNNCCEAWKQDGTRVCRWTKVTSVYYHHRRTSCETWYSAIYNWESGWDSWRFSANYPYTSESCTEVQKDTVAPIWVGVSE